MAFTNSPLVNHVRLCNDYTKGRYHKTYNPEGKIKKITIHHMAGNLSVEKCGELFATSPSDVSSTYGIGTDGRIGLYVEEKNRPWTSSSAANDYQAVTIEVANDKIGGNWHVSDKALASLINLCVDICKRNGIKKLNFTGDKTGNLTMHKYFAATECPGPYLESKFSYIAAEVNKRLTANTFKSYTIEVTSKTLYVREGAGTNYKVKTSIKKGERYTITAEKTVSGLKWGKLKSGLGWISLRHTKKIVKEQATFKPGDKVKLKSNATIYGSSDRFTDWVYGQVLYVREVKGSRVVISTKTTGNVTGAVDKKYLTKF